MHLIELYIHKFLEEVNKGGYKIAPNLLKNFNRSIDASLQRQFEREDREFTIRMSNIGRPICQLELEQAGIKGSGVEVDQIRNLYGDVSEKILMFLLHAAGVPVIAEQANVEVTVGSNTATMRSTRISGTLDCVIDFGQDPRVWDIKSSSGWAFKNKYNKTFEEYLKEDTFGYGEQLFLYAEGYGCAVGGLIVFNKESGEIRIIEAPKEQKSLRTSMLRNIEDKINLLNKQRPVLVGNGGNKKNPSSHSSSSVLPSRKLPDSLEYFYRKPTGNKIANISCQFCDKKFHCWPDIKLKPKAMSKASNPPLIWYTEYKEQ